MGTRSFFLFLQIISFLFPPANKGAVATELGGEKETVANMGANDGDKFVNTGLRNGKFLIVGVISELEKITGAASGIEHNSGILDIIGLEITQLSDKTHSKS